jgi:hypothetical protein
MFAQFNFDMLKALIEEMNRYDETPQEALSMLNAKPEFAGESKFKVELRNAGKMLDKQDCEPDRWSGNPLTTNTIHASYDTDPADDDSTYKYLQFTTEDLVQVLPKEGRFVYKQGDVELTLIREQEKPFHWDAF